MHYGQREAGITQLHGHLFSMWFCLHLFTRVAAMREWRQDVFRVIPSGQNVVSGVDGFSPLLFITPCFSITEKIQSERLA